MTSISNAVENRNCRILQLLVAIPGTFSLRDAESSMLLATHKGYADCVKVFLDLNINPNMKESSAKSLLMIAAEQGHTDVVRLLVRAKSEINMHHRSGETALHFAARNGRESCVLALVQGGANVNSTDSDGNTPLLAAAKHCRNAHKAMKELIKCGCKLDIQDNKLRTALHYTSYMAIGTEPLLSAGANPNIQDIDGNAPVHLAAIEGFDTIVQCLVVYNCNPNLINKCGRMAVHYMAMKGHELSILAIVSVGGDLDHPDSDGKIPLWYAVNHDRVSAVVTLLQANCCPDPPDQTVDPNAAGVGLANPLETSLEKKLYNTAKQLLLAGSNPAPLCQFLINYTQQQRETAEEQAGRSTLFTAEEPQHIDESEAAVMQWFDHWLRNPHTLCQICRVRILQYLRSKRLKRDHLQHLPSALNDYVMLRELGE